ncbi:DUF2934 domain-containing protein [Pseudomonas mandelii]|uniref:DUF2934 domain-containing protein n=1 Tax=Pseudomonas mandelii TaxID=75612 RepID=UPI003A4C6153
MSYGRKLTMEEQQIREAAYRLWEKEGKPQGQDLNRPGFSRHLASSLRNAFQTLPVTVDC